MIAGFIVLGLSVFALTALLAIASVWEASERDL